MYIEVLHVSLVFLLLYSTYYKHSQNIVFFIIRLKIHYTENIYILL